MIFVHSRGFARSLAMCIIFVEKVSTPHPCSKSCNLLFIHHILQPLSYHLSFVIFNLSSVLSTVLHHLSFIFCHISFSTCHWWFVICFRSFIIRHLSSVFYCLSYVNNNTKSPNYVKQKLWQIYFSYFTSIFHKFIS